MRVKQLIAVIIIELLMLGMVSKIAASAVLPLSKLPTPRIDQNSWIMIEIWPDVQDITLAAYFLDFAYGKNQNLCSATKRVFDREQAAQEKRERKRFSSYRLCLPLSDAVEQGYVRTRQ